MVPSSLFSNNNYDSISTQDWIVSEMEELSGFSFFQEEEKEAVLRRLEQFVEASPQDSALRFNLV